MAIGHVFAFGAQPEDVAENVYNWLNGSWEGLGGAERQAVIICICAIAVFYFVVRRTRSWGAPKESKEEESDEHLRLLEAVQARACENEVLHGRLLNQVYKAKLLKKEMRWLRECLRMTQESLHELRKEHDELRSALTEPLDERNSGPEGDADISRPGSAAVRSRGPSSRGTGGAMHSPTPSMRPKIQNLSTPLGSPLSSRDNLQFPDDMPEPPKILQQLTVGYPPSSAVLQSPPTPIRLPPPSPPPGYETTPPPPKPRTHCGMCPARRRAAACRSQDRDTATPQPNSERRHML